MAEVSDTVRVAPHVLKGVLRVAIDGVPGVVRPGIVPAGRVGVLGAQSGFALRSASQGLSVDCYLVALPGAHLPAVGAAVQASVAAVLREIVHVDVREVNVIIQDVGFPRGETVAHG